MSKPAVLENGEKLLFGIFYEKLIPKCENYVQSQFNIFDFLLEILKIENDVIEIILFKNDEEKVFSFSINDL